MAAGCLTDEFTESQGTEGIGKDFRITIGQVIDEQNQRAAPFTIERPDDGAFAAIAMAEDGVFLASRG